MDFEMAVKSFSVEDTRPGCSKTFAKVVPSQGQHGEQLMLQYSSTSAGLSNLLITLDKPVIILVLDQIFMIKDWFLSPYASVEVPVAETTRVHSATQPIVDTFSYRINFAETEIALLENPENNDTEAIVLSAKHLVVAHDQVTTLSFNQVSASVCRMSAQEESRVRLLSNFDLTATMANRPSPTGYGVLSINIECTPLLVRVSYRDIFLVMLIANRVTALSGQAETAVDADAPSKSTKSADPVDDLSWIEKKGVQESLVVLSREKVR